MAKRRRSKGEGSIFRRKNGRWVGSYELPGGKRTRRYVYGDTKESVIDQLLVIRQQAKRGDLTAPLRMTLKAYLEHWLTTKKVSQRSIEDYDSVIRNHVNPVIGGIQIDKLNHMHIEQAMAKAGSESLKEKVYVLLRQSLQRLVPATIRNNPCQHVVRPRPEPRKMQPLNQEQAEAFLEGCEGNRLEALFVLAIMTGARQGELLALTRDDVDLKSNEIVISKSLSHPKGGPVIKGPKSKAARRRISIPEKAAEVLHDHRKRMLREGNGSAPFFCTKPGAYLHPSNIRKQYFYPILEDNDLPKIRFHDLRHTHATLLLLAGTHPKVVQERLGHAKVSITLDTYSHVLPSMQAQAAATLDAMFAS